MVAKRCKPLKIIYRTALVIAASCMLSLLITGAATGKPTLFGFKPLFVPTKSMEPVIHAGSLVLAMPAEPEELKIGDVAVYQSPQHYLVVHRIIGIDGDIYTFKGDNNVSPDDPVQKDQILYRVSSI